MKTKMLAKSLIIETIHNDDCNINYFKQSMVKKKFYNDLIDKNKKNPNKFLSKLIKTKRKQSEGFLETNTHSWTKRKNRWSKQKLESKEKEENLFIL